MLKSCLSQKYKLLDLNNLDIQKVVCLTLDVEQDYGDLLQEPTYEGLKYISKLVGFLKEKNIPLTCFVQASLLETHASYIDPFFLLDVEFELHSYSHPGPESINFEFEVKKGKQVFKQFFARDPVGYRSPLGFIDEEGYKILVSHEFKFDSSIFPSIRPGIFNNLTKPTRPYILNGYSIVEFPFTVFSEIIRVPVALSYIKLLGKPYLDLIKFSSLPSLIIFDFHLHDIFNLTSASKIFSKDGLSPLYKKIFKKIYVEGDDGFLVFKKFIQILQKKDYVFLKLSDVYKALLNENHNNNPK